MQFLLAHPRDNPGNSFSLPIPGVIHSIPSPCPPWGLSTAPSGLTPLPPSPFPDFHGNRTNFRLFFPRALAVTSRSSRHVTSRPPRGVTAARGPRGGDVSAPGRGGAKSGGTSGSGAGRRGNMSWIPFKIGQPKKQIVPKTVERDFEREYGKLQQLEDQTKKLQKDMKKSTDADLAMSKSAVKISSDLLSNPLCEQEPSFLEMVTAFGWKMLGGSWSHGMVGVGRDSIPCHSGRGTSHYPRVIQPGLGHVQGWSSHSFSGNSILAPHNPHREGFLPKIPSIPALWQWEAIPCVLSLPALSRIFVSHLFSFLSSSPRLFPHEFPLSQYSGWDFSSHGRNSLSFG
uniref:Bridging integrator 3 n=1 Tax=Cyanistes caeruleus TaxID=156563 RepID=A0A8C0UBK4_CYACU